MNSFGTRIQSIRQRMTSLPALDGYRYRYAFSVTSAILVTIFFIAVTNILHFYPIGWQILLAILIAGLWVINPSRGLLVLMAALTIPVAYTYNFGGLGLVFIGGILLALAGLLNPYSFLFVLLAVVCFVNNSFGIFLFVIPLAIGFLSPARAAFQAAIIAFILELLMIQGGRTTTGPMTLGIVKSPILFHNPPANVTSLANFNWLNVAGDPGAMAGKLIG